MRTILKRAAAILALFAVMLLMMPIEHIPAANKVPITCQFTQSISDAPMSKSVDELHKGVTYYAGFKAWEKYSGEFLDDSYFPFTAEAKIINPAGEIVDSITLDSADIYVGTLIEDYKASYFYVPFEPDMLGTWTASVTYHIMDGNDRDWGPYEVQKECTVPSTELTAWLSDRAMGEMIHSVRKGDTAFLCYALKDKATGEILDDRITGYTVTMEVIGPDGNAGGIPYSRCSASGSTLIWPPERNGTWRAVITVKGDISERIELQWKVGILLGDVNGDAGVDAGDAADILVESAAGGTGASGTFTPEQNAAADVDRNGTVDASDAAIILSYAAALGSGKISGTLEENLKYIN